MSCPWGRRSPDLSKSVLTCEEKTWIANEVISGSQTPAQLQTKYQISVFNIRRWVRIVREGRTIQNGGRPTSISPNFFSNIEETLNKGQINVTSEEFRSTVNKFAIDTAQARRNIASSQVKLPSRRTLHRLEEKLGIKTGNAEFTTNARAIACADVRNAVSMCAAQHLMVPLTDHYLILNMDGTQYKTGCDSSKKEKVKYRNSPTKGKALKVLPSAGKKNNGITAFFIKHYMLMSAGGCCADPIFVIADDNMEKEQCDVHVVPGLGNSIDIANKAYVVFTKTRCANAKFYEWFNSTVLVSFVSDLRRLRNLPDDSMAWFQLDGEAIQIECYRQGSNTLQLMTEHNIVIGKPAASTTEITQPCDAGDCFKATKTKNKFINDEDILMDNHMYEQLQKVFVEHMKNATPSKKMSSAHVKMAINGLQRVHLAIKSAVSPQMIKESFTRTGIYDYRKCSYNPSQILAQCKNEIRIEEETQILSVIPNLAAILGDKGELVDKDFEEYNIRYDATIKSKDNLVLSRRRMILLTNSVLVHNEEMKRRQKILETNQKLERKRIRDENKENRKIKVNRKNTVARKLEYLSEEEEDEKDQ
mmetsp:Transcript_32984/g.45233  ORF Transcript_32984/g.45233 Transcript_32984/m.45233 type:complete len:589 (-) Transcript_32984:104-1870(-)